jgi:hypothetical protein
MMASAANLGGTKMMETLAWVASIGVLHRVEHRAIKVQFAAFARGDAADNIGTILDHLTCVKASFLTGEALHDDPRVFINKNTHVFRIGSILRGG